MLSNNQNQPKCLKCGMPMNESTCSSCGFNVLRDSLLSIDKVSQIKDFYKSELAFFKEHNVDHCYQTGLKYYYDGNYKEAFKWYQNRRNRDMPRLKTIWAICMNSEKASNRIMSKL